MRRRLRSPAGCSASPIVRVGYFHAEKRSSYQFKWLNWFQEINLLLKGDGPVKKMMVALIATIFLVSLLGCAAQMADKAAWDEQTQKTMEAQDAVTTYNRIGGR